ncbi:MAG: T9SS type A sorting domain-containing protein, partial [Saprospiraceae bacterium]
GTAFASIGRVKGAGTTQIPQAYAFDDLDPLPGVNYYRLRQTDYDGASEYSPVVSVRMDGPGYVISPMPVSGTARVAFDKPTESDTHWRVFASDGALLRAGQVRVGEQGFEFDLNALPAGVYVLRMEQANWAKSERIFKTTLR